MSSLVPMKLLKSRKGSGAGSADQMLLVLLKKVIVDNMIMDHNIVTNKTNRSMHKQKGVDFTRGINFSVRIVIENFERYLSPVECSCIRRQESCGAGGARPDPRPP